MPKTASTIPPDGLEILDPTLDVVQPSASGDVAPAPPSSEEIAARLEAPSDPLSPAVTEGSLTRKLSPEELAASLGAPLGSGEPWQSSDVSEFDATSEGEAEGRPSELTEQDPDDVGVESVPEVQLDTLTSLVSEAEIVPEVSLDDLRSLRTPGTDEAVDSETLIEVMDGEMQSLAPSGPGDGGLVESSPEMSVDDLLSIPPPDVLAEEIAELEEGSWDELEDGLEETSLDELDATETSDEHVAHDEKDERNYRKIYERDFRGLEVGARVEWARTATGSRLRALCHDQEPKVIAALMDNPNSALQEARAIASHHLNGRGLEILGRRRELLRDGQVQRCLLRNTQLPVGVLRHIASTKVLRDLYRLSCDRNVIDRLRSRLRAELRKKYSISSPEERVDLVFRTDGRALGMLAGMTFDGRMTSLLASRSIHSTLLIQNLARFLATPSVLLAKLLKQPTVRRQPQLRTMLLRHPNMPSDMKRRG